MSPRGELDGVAINGEPATVADAPLTAGSPLTITATEGTPTTATIGHFTDANAGSTAGDFSATLDRGDG